MLTPLRHTPLLPGTLQNFAAIGSTLFFSANGGATGTELWKSDGTSNGTVLVKDIQTGILSSGPANLTRSR